LDPHVPVGESFAFIKKQHDTREATFVIHIYQGTIYTTADSVTKPAHGDTHVQHVERRPEEQKYFQWAFSKRNGRPHPRESRELHVKKGEKVKVLQDAGRDWYIVEGRGGVKGWMHGSWMDRGGSKVHRDPWSTYAQFQKDMRKLLVPGQLREFPRIGEYMQACTNTACEPLRSGTQLGICVHDLQTLLEGSGCYSYEWLKEERNVWHPDKFARYCRPEHKDRLKTSAQEVFVLYGVLMDMCSQQ
jgi:methylenetetrahydrofolate dehydrogenase (NADP+)/methenyltetrahydrofolate cyclohydrolase/formyltetrahydrofolate synthetase